MATISQNCSRDPQIGERHENGKWRTVIGWNHTDDTEEGLKEGQVWCWVSAPPEKLQVYDKSFNRSPMAGEVRFCGVANFTMVRMFHPYWTLFGSVPRDGKYKDKRRCRDKYHLLMRKHRASLGLPVDDDFDASTRRIAMKNRKLKGQERAQAEQGNQHIQTGAAFRIHERDNINQSIRGTVEVLPGGSRDDAILID